jgi:uncharacterized protein YdeI (BOF family)
MKKLFLLFASFALVFGLVACEDTVTVDPAQTTLQGAYDTLNGLISDPSNITGNFTVPTLLVGGVDAVWSSNNPGVVTVGQPANNLAIVTVNRPAFGDPNAKVTLSAVLTIPASLDETKELTLTWNIELTVKANEVEEVNIENIADVLALKDVAYDGTYQVSLKGLTIIGKGSDSAFAYDGTGIIQIYGGDFSGIEVGKVYDVSGTTEWYFGIWELVSWTAELDATATPQMPTPEVITDIAAYVNGLLAEGQDEFAYGNASSGAFETVYATVTGRVYVIPGDTSNYNTYIMPTNYNTTQAWVPGTTEAPTVGLMIYYNTFNMTNIQAYNGKVITVDMLIYTFRSNNKAFAFYYIGGADGITANLTDAEAIEVDSNALSISFNILEDTTLDLKTTGTNGTTIVWTSDNEAVINPTTGVVTIPTDGQATVKLTATVSLGTATAVVKEFTVKVGLSPVVSISEALEIASGELAVIQGYVTVNVDGNNFLLQDETGAIDLFLGTAASAFKDAVLAASLSGDLIEVVGTRGAFRGLEQLSNLTSVTVVPVPEVAFPIIVDVTSLAQLQSVVGQLVRLRNLEVVSIAYDSFNNLDITAKLGTETVVIRWDARTGAPSGLPTELEAGDIINVVAGVFFSNNPLLRIDSADDVSLPPMTITAALAEATSTVVTVEGYVTMNVDGNNFFIQDATGAIDVFAGGGANPTKDQLLRAWQGRYAIQITAARGSFNGLEQLATITEIMIVDKIGSAFPTPTVVTSIADLSTYKAQQIRLQGLVFVSQAKDSFGNIDFTFTLGSENVVVRWDSRNGTPVGFPLTLVEGDIIDAVVGVFWSNAARLRIDSKGAFTLPPMTIAAALTQAADTVVTIRGYVTLNVDGNNFLFQDNTGALDVFLGSGASAEKDAIRAAFLGGYAIEIQATRGAFRGLQQVSSVQFVNVIPTPGFNFPTAVNVTAMDVTALNTYIAQLVEFKGLEVVSIAYDNFGNLDINVTNGTATFSIRWDARTGAPSGLPTELEAGDIINVVAGAYWSDQLRLRIASADAIEKVVVASGTTVTAAYTGATTNMVIDTNNAALIALDPDLFNVQTTLGEASVQVGLNIGGQIRVYANRATGNGNTLTISISSGYIITKVEIEFGASTNNPTAVLTLGTEASNLVSADLLNKSHVFNDLSISSFSLKNTQNTGGSGSNAQIYILSIKITYDTVE